MVMEEAATPIYHGCPKGQHKESLVLISLPRPGETVCMKQLSICLMSSQFSVLHTHGRQLYGSFRVILED